MKRNDYSIFANEPRMRREARTIDAMIRIYCQKNHGQAQGLCEGCTELRDYAFLRLRKCPFGEEKSTCANCRVHCYRPDMRERVRDVMRFSGPHMVYRHPILAFMHLAVDDRRPAPELPKRVASQSGGVSE
ncbi:MAG: nitrous oxide-stimulated promoter family protein [Caldilineales bacterium]|nr:nitrous oxide-stimulated promoter family protein [Caldilineales bacterium]